MTANETSADSSKRRAVYVVDDDEAVRDSLRWLLEANAFEVVVLPGADQLLARARLTARLDDAGCLLLDVRMPGMSGLELQDELIRMDIRVPQVFITGHGDVPMAVNCVKKGAVDFIEKPFSEEQLCALVRQCLNRCDAEHASANADREAAQRLSRLTARERQVLDLIVAGRLNKQIADDLTISIKTVEAHRANLMHKLGARTMADLMRTALAGRGPRSALD
ncbi:MAG: response regulator [Burkholderiaceae bacterium]|nr:response regulator [Burkholderiaceae bacterium]